MAQVDAFIKIDGVDGESKDDKHADEIDILSWDVGFTQGGTAGKGTGQGSGKVTPRDLTIVKQMDKSSPVLYIACATGQVFKDAVLSQRKAGGQQDDFLVVTLEGVVVSDLTVNGGSAGADSGGTPTETVSLNYQRLEYSYKPQDEKGAMGGEIKQKYDFEKNVKV